MKAKLIRNTLFFIIVFIFGIFFEQITVLYKNILFNTNTTILLVTLIAGLFGFMVAVIPFAIQLFNQDNTKNKNDFLNRLMTNEKFNFFVKPMFNRFIRMLYIMFCLFAYAILLTILETNKENLKLFSFLYEMFFGVAFYKYLIIILFYFYIILIIEFFIMLRNIIRDLQTLVFNFFKSKESELKENKND